MSIITYSCAYTAKRLDANLKIGAKKTDRKEGKQMFARVSAIEGKLEWVEDVIRTLEEQLIPALEKDGKSSEFLTIS